MERGFTSLMKKDVSILDSLKTITHMAMGYKQMLMEANMKVILPMDAGMELVWLLLLMGHVAKLNIDMEKELTEFNFLVRTKWWK